MNVHGASQSSRDEAVRGLIVRTRTDADLRTRFLWDPERTLRENGIDAPDGVALRPVDARRDTSYLVLPSAALKGAVFDEDLHSANGGTVITPMVIYGIIDWASG